MIKYFILFYIVYMFVQNIYLKLKSLNRQETEYSLVFYLRQLLIRWQIRLFRLGKVKLLWNNLFVNKSVSHIPVNHPGDGKSYDILS